jgi:iron(III) transport system substrate-binding protein
MVRLARFAAVAVVVGLLGACGPASSAPRAAAVPSPPPANASGREADGPTRWDQLVQAAKQEGKVVVVTHTDLLYRSLLERFRQRYPEVQVEHLAIRPSEFAPKVVTEQQNGVFGYDVWISPTSNMVEVVLPAGGFEDLTRFLVLPEVTEPQHWRGGALLYATKQPYIVLNRGNVGGSVWVNRDLLSAQDFNDMDQLLAEHVKGKVMIRTPNAPHQASLVLAGVLHSKGEDFVWRLLSQQQPVFIENARLLTQNLINGRYPLAIGIDTATIDNCMQASGCRHLEEVRGNPYLLGHGISVLKRPPHPNAAAVLLNWFLTREGQEAFKDAIISTKPPPHDEAHSIRADVEPHPDALRAGTMPDYATLGQYSLQGMEQGKEEMQTVIGLYRKLEAGGGR